MALARLPDDSKAAVSPLPVRAADPLMRVGSPGRSSGISARPVHELDPDTPRLVSLDDTTVENADRRD